MVSRRAHISRPGFVAAVCAFAVLATLAVTALAAGPTVTKKAPGKSPLFGIEDDRIVGGADPVARVRLLVEAGASVVRIPLRWDLVAASKPAAPANPADPAYDWSRYDAMVAAANANHAAVLFTVYGTPAWARDPAVPADPHWPAFSARPFDPTDFGRFGEVAARRYAPRGVHRWEAWNEPNISLFLRPQYGRSGGKWVPTSPATYSAMLTSFSTRVKAADPTAVVAGAVTAPAGDRCPDCPLDRPPTRVTPGDFIAALGTPGLRPPMDVVSHHPYPLRKPTDSTPAGRTYVDVYNLSVLTRAIDATYLRGKKLWLTEFGFATRPVPEYPIAFSRAQQAAYIVDAYRRMKANPRVTLAVYYFLQDHAGWASGILEQSGAKKPGAQALALPFAAAVPGPAKRGSSVALVGQVRASAGAATVLVQRKASAKWVTLKTLRTAGDGSFKVALRPTAKMLLRAKWSGRTRIGTPATMISPPVTITVR